MGADTPYGNIEFAPFTEVPVDEEWARNASAAAEREPTVTSGGVKYHIFPLWLNCAMEDQGLWDDEVNAVHGLLDAASPLNDDFRIMRLQITSYEACHYSFPDSLLKLIACIGKGTADRTLMTGCDSHYGRRPDDPSRQQRIAAYAAILDAWAAQNSLSDAVSSRRDHEADVRNIYRMLGQWTKLKSLYARRLALLIGLINKVADAYDSYSGHHCYPSAAEIDREIFLAEGIPAGLIPDPLDEKAFVELCGRCNPLLKKISSYYAAVCRLNLFHHFDIWISSVGCGEWRCAMPPTGESRRGVERTVANMACALNDWLAGLDPEASSQQWPDALDTCKRVQKLLGASTPQKRYLAAMLWKRLKHQKGFALIENNPEVFRAQWI